MDIENNLNMNNDSETENKPEKDNNHENREKNKPYFKLTGSLRSEHITVVTLCICSIIFLIGSLLLEYVGNKYIRWPIKRMVHIDFLANLFLGIAVSAFVTYISIFFPFKQRKDQQVNDILTKLKDIYFHYTDIYNSINKNNPSENFLFEELLIEDIDNLHKEINEELIEYRNTEFKSSGIDKINNLLSTKIIDNLSIISMFCLYLYNHNQGIVYSNLSDNILESMKTTNKKPRIKHIEVRCYQFLLNTIDENYSYSALTDQYHSAFGPEITMGYIKQHLSNLTDSFIYGNNIVIRSEQFMIINNGIKDIILQTNNEATELLNRSSQINKNIDELGITNHSFLDKINDVRTLIRSDELEKARQLLDNLDKEIENYSQRVSQKS